MVFRDFKSSAMWRPFLLAPYSPSAFLYFLFIRTMTGKFAFGTHLPSLLLFVLCACNAVLYGDKNEIQRKSCNVESLFLVLITSERIIIQSTTSLKQRFRGNFGRSCILQSRWRTNWVSTRDGGRSHATEKQISFFISEEKYSKNRPPPPSLPKNYFVFLFGFFLWQTNGSRLSLNRLFRRKELASTSA